VIALISITSFLCGLSRLYYNTIEEICQISLSLLLIAVLSLFPEPGLFCSAAVPYAIIDALRTLTLFHWETTV
jgi:hypothetical protein